MTRGIFITGTDTGVGKTHCAVAIVRELRRRGADVGVMKPVETGCRNRGRRLVPADAVALMKAAGVQEDLWAVNPYRFAAPLAPSIAARLERQVISKRVIMQSFRRLSHLHDVVVVEGAGGVLVPLTRSCSFLDLASAMALPVLIVARPSLGTINHTLLTVQALQARTVPIAGIVINYAEDRRPGLAERTAPAEIERLSGVPIVGTVLHGAESVRGVVDSLLSPRGSRGRG